MTTIKVDRLQVIKTLTDKADAMEAGNKAYDDARKKHEKAEEAWQKAMFKAAIKHSTKAIDVRISSAWRNDSVTNIDFNIPTNLLPARPDRDDFFTVGGRELEWNSSHQIDEIRQFVRVLEMGTDDTINMSALKNVSQYL